MDVRLGFAEFEVAASSATMTGGAARDIRVGWAEFDTQVAPLDIRIGWCEFDATASAIDVRVGYCEFDVLSVPDVIAQPSAAPGGALSGGGFSRAGSLVTSRAGGMGSRPGLVSELAAREAIEREDEEIIMALLMDIANQVLA